MKQIFTLILSLALVQAFGQTPAIVMQVIASAGGTQTGGSIIVDWTLGEPVIGNVSGGSILLTQGFQQGNLLGTDIPIDPEEINSSFKMFPNPARDKVRFVIDNKNAKGDFIVDVFDITGRKVLSQKLGLYEQLEEKSLQVSTLKAGVYLVSVTVGGFRSGLMKLIKE